jgi:Animal haem peroxidase
MSMTTAPERPRTAGALPEELSVTPEVPRVLTNVHHGGHVVVDDLAVVDPTRAATATVTWADVKKISTPFGYLFDDLRGDYPAAHLPADSAATVVASLKALGTAMVEQPGDPAAADSTIPPIYTYWGQFVDHDLTANTDRNDDIGITDLPLEPLQPEKVVSDLRNLRQPQLNLDSVYGNGPDFSGLPDQVPYTGDTLDVGSLRSGPPGNDVLAGHDLPRDTTGIARIGDARNDENLVVAQLHTAFLKFHNAVLTWFAANPGSPVTGDGSFARARQLVEWHYQWITVHDFLKKIARTDVVDGLLDGTITPRFGIDENTPPDKVFMPLEYSVAAYRFGHSMVRAAYDWNSNFGFPRVPTPPGPPPTGPAAGFDLLFAFTGGGQLLGAKLPDNWPAQFERLTGADPRPASADKAVPARFARRIDTHLAPPLGNLNNQAVDETSMRIRRILRRLAVRNLLRGYRLAIPTGQAVARSLGIPPLTRAQLITPEPPQQPAPFLPSPVDDALVDGGFLEDTPLWFYVLREAEVLEGGQRLGPVGSRIVAETILGQLRADPTSFLSQGWDPSQGVTIGADPVDSIIRFLQFAGMHP